VPPTSGYSGTPLSAKLGYKAASRVLLVNAPADYAALLEPMPDGLVFEPKASARTEFAHVFVTQKEELAGLLTSLRQALKPAAAVWVSWPKKSSRVPTTVTEDTIRVLALPLGFVDIKVCAVSEVWSGLKLVVRKDLRA
jgi:hypothetical protein